MRKFILFFAMVVFVLSAEAQNKTVVDTTICAETTYEFYEGSTPVVTINVDHPLVDSVCLYGTPGSEDTLVLTLNFYPVYDLQDAKTICSSELPYTYGDSIFPIGTITGNYPVHFQSVSGCDSLITLSLTVNPSYSNTDVATICDSELPYTYGDSVFPIGTITGNYPVHFQSVSGCDSLITLSLTVNPSYSNTDVTTICDSELPYTYGDSIFPVGTVTGDYPVHFESVSGCDSLITLSLTVNPSYSNTDVATICDSELPYTYGDSIFPMGTVTGDYPVHFESVSGCDSLITLTLTVNPTYSNTDAVTISESDLPYTYGDSIFPVGTVTGDYPVYFQTVNGCDSLVTLTLTVNPDQTEEMVISWLPADDKRVSAFGGGESATVAAVMEFYVEDLINFNSTNKSIIGLNQVQFYIDSAALPSVTGCRVIVMQGEDITTATELINQSVVVGNLVKHWNYVDLTNEYNVNLGQRLYIGYEVSVSGTAYPLSVAKGTNSKQGWIRINTSAFQNIVTAGYQNEFLIKAVAIVENSPNVEIMLTALNLEKYKMVGDSVAVKGTIKNFGTVPVTSFKLVYEVDGVQSSVETFTGLSIAVNASYDFIHPKQYVFDTAKLTNIVVTVSEPNDVMDKTSNNTREGRVIAYSTAIQRAVLHEVFTSSTCPPCNAGNKALMNVLHSVDSNKWACIKYQFNFPGTGDPYYILECSQRADFYGGISSVPTLFGDGQYRVNPTSYTVSKLTQLASVPAVATMTGIAEVRDNTVSLDLTINPVSSIDISNMRLFAAIVEKKTFKNVKSNGETEFEYVLKKFMTDAEGDIIDPLVLNTPVRLDYNYTFNGDYRLPANANNPINPAIENSVEDFKALMVVYWLQDISTKEVFQAGKADPYPGYTPTSITGITSNPFGVVIYPNPVQDMLHIDADMTIEQMEIFNMLGQRVKLENTNAKEISTMDLSTGYYILRITSDKGVSIHKFVKE